MTMVYQYINCITEFGLHQATLIITDTDGLVREQRVDKVFEDDVTIQEMADEAARSIDLWIAQVAQEALDNGG